MKASTKAQLIHAHTAAGAEPPAMSTAAIQALQASHAALLRRAQQNEVLLALSNDIAATSTKDGLMAALNLHLRNLFPLAHTVLGTIDEAAQTGRPFILDPESRMRNNTQYDAVTQRDYHLNNGIFDTAIALRKPLIFDLGKLVEENKAPEFAVMNFEGGIQEMAVMVLRSGHKNVGVLLLFAAGLNTFRQDHLDIIQGVSYQLSVALSKLLAHEKIEAQLREIERYREQLQEEKQYLQEEIGGVYNYAEIVGTAPEMHHVFRLVSQVAPSASSVLLLGETGTGKELVARAIHNHSPRRDKLMVKVNCASLPAHLIERELFGHEKDSFTGATARRIGKFELANGGTLFLDEIGEMPLELQVKLLRALQEKEIERIGGQAPVKVDVRIIAATNRNLQKEVSAGRFRSDLFYRLDVFPILLPPLRDRKEDIPALAAHFLARYSRKTGRACKLLSSKVLQEMMAYHWPGNIRELEHLIERSVLLTPGQTIREVPLPATDRQQREGRPGAGSRVKTIDENERDHILAVLKIANGRVSGPGGAAELLEVPATTLNSKMKRLGITREHVLQR